MTALPGDARDRLAAALVGRWLSYGDDKGADDLTEHPDRDGARITAEHAPLLADALLPVVAELADQAAAEVIRPFEELFGGGPDTTCRTTWRESAAAPECSAASVECVEVPMDDLRDAFAAALAPTTEGTSL